jgi:site-specific recombinase XerD
MKQTFTVLFYLKKSKINSKGKAPIYVRVTVNGKRSEMSIKQFVEPSKWNPIKQRLNGSNYHLKTINKSIELVVNKINEIHNSLIQNNKFVSAKAITNKYLGRDQLGKTLLEVFDYHNELMKAGIGIKFAKSTFVKYNTTYNHLEEFIKHEYNVPDLLLFELNHAFITSFDHFLSTIKALRVNSTNKYLSHLKKIVNLAIQNEWLLRNPFVNFKIKNEKVDVEFLTEDELTILSRTKLTNESLIRVKDIFLFCCFTGLSYVDIKNLRKTELDIGIDGKIWIRKKRQKTGGLCRIRILPIAKVILDKYDCNTNLLFPVTSNQNMNRGLKKITLIAGLQKQLSMHMARHTFATYALTKNVSIESISQMLGHKSIKSTEIYAKVVDSKISVEMDVFSQSIPKEISLPKVG